MKKVGCFVLMASMMASLFVGCGPVDSDSSLVSVRKNGKVQTVDVEAFDESYYSQEEFQTFAQDVINDYNQSKGAEAVALKGLTVEEGVAKLKMEFATVKDYSSFSGITLFQGSVADALAAGYLFEADFMTVEGGELKLKATKSHIFELEGLKVIIIGANTDVKVPGSIYYVSTENVSVVAEDTVSIRDEESTSLESDVYTYIIYK